MVSSLAERYQAQFPSLAENQSLTGYKEFLERTGRLTPVLKEAFSFAETVKEKYEVVAYIAGALTKIDEETKERYTQTSQLLETHGIFGYAPHLYGTDPKKHPEVTPSEVRDVDYLWAGVLSNFHVNWLSPVAHGNAIEAGWGEQKRVPAIMLGPNERIISRLVKGLINVDIIIGYQSENEGLAALGGILDKMDNWRNDHPNEDVLGFFAERKGLMEVKRYPSEYSPEEQIREAKERRFSLAYVADFGHSRYGQVGWLTGYDWREHGGMWVLFPDGVEEFFWDGDKDLHRPPKLVLMGRDDLDNAFSFAREKEWHFGVMKPQKRSR